MMSDQLTFLCISCYFKGVEFLKACHDCGHRVILITSNNLRDNDWPWDSIDQVYYMEENEDRVWDNEALIKSLAYLQRSTKIDRVVALDDFDVERVALIREEFRFSGMGQTTARYFRDKLAMRTRACDGGILVPEFSALFHDEEINHWARNHSPPWVVKPRGEASATGIKKIEDIDHLWKVLHDLGDERHLYLIEQFVKGDVYHVDALTFDGKMIFDRCSKYFDTPLKVAHEGGIFRTMTMTNDTPEHKKLSELNNNLLTTFGMQFGASHSEFIMAEDSGELFFLETASRVGGAHIAEMIEAASNINLWTEWARIEDAQLRGKKYQLPPQANAFAGAIISLSRFRHPDDSQFNDPEIWWRMKKDHHIGFILKSDDPQKLKSLLESYGHRIARDFHASLDAPARSAH